MPVYKADALILRTYKLGEADRIVVFLTRDRGKKRGVAKGARRPRSRYMGALEPMTRGEVAYYGVIDAQSRPELHAIMMPHPWIGRRALSPATIMRPPRRPRALSGPNSFRRAEPRSTCCARSQRRGSAPSD